MPNINIEEFDKEPSIGDKVRVEGKVESINDGVVEITYDLVKILDKDKKKRKKAKKRDNDDDDDDDDDDDVEIIYDDIVTVDDALEQTFNRSR